VRTSAGGHGHPDRISFSVPYGFIGAASSSRASGGYDAKWTFHFSDSVEAEEIRAIWQELLKSRRGRRSSGTRTSRSLTSRSRGCRHARREEGPADPAGETVTDPDPGQAPFGRRGRREELRRGRDPVGAPISRPRGASRGEGDKTSRPRLDRMSGPGQRGSRERTRRRPDRRDDAPPDHRR